jgi:REP element-mobilizing transposase RayT
MARPLRIQYPHAVYHVTARGNERNAIVRDDIDRDRFVQTVAEMVEHYRVVCHAWVLMDNHYHLLIETPDPNLSRAIRHLNGVYTQAFNRRHHRVGHLFQGRFKAILVDKETYLLELCRYVVLNPVRAGMVKHPHTWRWSSYRGTVGTAPSPSWLSVDWLLGQMADQQHRAREVYRRFVNEGIKRPESPWTKLSGQIYLGSEAFLKKVQTRLEARKDSEVPRVHRHPVIPKLEDLLDWVGRAYGEKVEEMVKSTRRPGEARQVAIYLARRVAGLDLRRIAKSFGMGYTGVSRRVGKIARRIEKDKSLSKRVSEIIDANVKT